MNTQHRRWGFTVVELLAVMAIGSLCTLNFLPALTQAREAARRTQCKNNLKQLALALHNYHDTFNSFPPGVVVRDWDSANEQGVGWMAQILPYMDQAPMYNELYSGPNRSGGSRLDEMAADPKLLQLQQTAIPTYRCPTDVTPPLNPFRGNYATSNYSGNFGSTPFPRLAPSVGTDYWPGQMATPRNRMLINGIFFVNSKIGIRDIVDGTSNTVMGSERGSGSLAGIWAGMTSTSHENDVLTDMSDLSRPNGGWSSFSSPHDGGLHVMLCDGSVRFLDDTVESKPSTVPGEMGIYQKLGSRQDGQVMGAF